MPGGMVLGMVFKMPGQGVDSSGQKGNLDLRRAGILLTPSKFFNKFSFIDTVRIHVNPHLLMKIVSFHPLRVACW